MGRSPALSPSPQRRRIAPVIRVGNPSLARESRPTTDRYLVDSDSACSPGLGSSSSTTAKYAELVPLWVGQHHPRRIHLTDIGPTCAETDETPDLSFLVVGPEVQMQSILDLLGLYDRCEDQARDLISARTNLELVWVVVNDHPAERLEPPATERNRILSVDDRLLPVEAHAATIRALRSASLRTPGSSMRMAGSGTTFWGSEAGRHRPALCGHAEPVRSAMSGTTDGACRRTLPRAGRDLHESSGSFSPGRQAVSKPSASSRREISTRADCSGNGRHCRVRRPLPR